MVHPNGERDPNELLRSSQATIPGAVDSRTCRLARRRVVPLSLGRDMTGTVLAVAILAVVIASWAAVFISMWHSERLDRERVDTAARELLGIIDGLDIDPDANYRFFYAKRRLERLVGKEQTNG